MPSEHEGGADGRGAILVIEFIAQRLVKRNQSSLRRVVVSCPRN